MKEKRVIEKYYSDISSIKLPPISDRVHHAMREKKEKVSEFLEYQRSSVMSRNRLSDKFIFAAMIALLAVSVPVIIILTNSTSVPVVPDGSNMTDNSSSTSRVKEASGSPVVGANALERMKVQQLYGAVSLSGKSEKELEEILLTYNNDSQVYEDDSFIYNFDLSGNLKELLNKNSSDDNGKTADRELISQKAVSLLMSYYPEWKNYLYETNIKENEEAIPAWRVSLAKKITNLKRWKFL